MPSSITVRVGDSQAFSAIVTGTTNLSVTWAVNDTPGGSPATGLITVAGIYTPPAQLPVPNQVRITATSAADTDAKSTAQVTLANPIALVSFVYPSTLVSKAAFAPTKTMHANSCSFSPSVPTCSIPTAHPRSRTALFVPTYSQADIQALASVFTG
jgi:uncharacterized protein YjdB